MCSDARRWAPRAPGGEKKMLVDHSQERQAGELGLNSVVGRVTV